MNRLGMLGFCLFLKISNVWRVWILYCRDKDKIEVMNVNK